MAGPDWLDHLSTALPVLQPFNAMRPSLAQRMQPQQSGYDPLTTGWDQGHIGPNAATPIKAQALPGDASNLARLQAAANNVPKFPTATQQPGPLQQLQPSSLIAQQDKARQQRQDMLTQFLNRANPYAKTGDAYTAAMNSAYSRPSGLLQNALQNTQRSAAERGITLGSGLTQQMLNTNRNDAAKMAAQLGGQVDQDFAIRGAAWDDQRDQLAMQAAQVLGNWDFSEFDRLMSLGDQEYQRQRQSPLDALALESGRMANQSQANILGYQPRMLEQAYQGGQQALTAGDYNNRFLGQTLDPRIAATNAANHLGTLQGQYAAEALTNERDWYMAMKPQLDAQRMMKTQTAWLDQFNPGTQILGHPGVQQGAGMLAGGALG